MQRTETSVEERPQRAARVVPIEPSLSYRYYSLIYGAVVLLFVVITVFIAFDAIIGNSLLVGYSTLWQHSLLGAGSLGGVIYIVICGLTLSPWRTLDKRRQQAARYNLTVGTWARAIAPSKPNVPALPDFFVIDTRRGWLATGLETIVGIFFLSIIGIAIYFYWQDLLPAAQHGIPMVLIALVNGSNIAILLLVAAFIALALAFYARQQLIATRDGLIYRRDFRTSTIPWQQACLFAIIYQGNTRKQEPVFFYELASKDTTIRWPSSSKRVKQNAIATAPSAIALINNFSGLPVLSAAEFPQQVQFLNIIIAERTGLQLYDLR